MRRVLLPTTTMIVKIAFNWVNPGWRPEKATMNWSGLGVHCYPPLYEREGGGGIYQTCIIWYTVAMKIVKSNIKGKNEKNATFRPGVYRTDFSLEQRLLFPWLCSSRMWKRSILYRFPHGSIFLRYWGWYRIHCAWLRDSRVSFSCCKGRDKELFHSFGRSINYYTSSCIHRGCVTSHRVVTMNECNYYYKSLHFYETSKWFFITQISRDAGNRERETSNTMTPLRFLL